MLRLSIVAIVLGLLIASKAHAEAPAPATAAQVATRRAGVEFMPQVAIVSASSFTLNTENYSVPFSEAIQGIPTFTLGMRIPTGMLGGFETALLPRIGYGYKSGLVPVVRPDGSSKELLRLHSVTGSLLFQGLYEIPGISGLKFGANLGIGGLYAFQNANQAELNQSYLLPVLLVGPTVSFMDYGDADDWFHGFTFGVTLQNGLSSKHKYNAFSVELGMNIAF